MSELTTAPTSSISRALMASATAMTTASANINGSASLSNGAKAGIVIGASVGVLVLLTLVIWLQIRWSRRMGTKFPDALTPIYPDSFGYIHGYPGPYNTVLHDMSSRDVERAPQSKEQGVRVPKTVRFQETKPHVEEQIAIVSEARDGEAGKDRRNSRTSVLTGSTL
ncbi:hypothetical protein P152DRAFT_470871 [Eremomyces bilateralis CBS 781.70]|uniref:Uncharacterized protein n=1 Tax=Eremomyces bilateralis CBS 781.70 TaxID=1392243 RepID=A0A6G1GBG5_9PEZI|nr:uncharacterized protein P152DRAFT_470871 [Eremomyces bilateralis CBS 781.70]KAF1815437.1 hypothetical protein P152DRAFT_470871 [Eremomyces bilateralis CBS 781.70]